MRFKMLALLLFPLLALANPSFHGAREPFSEPWGRDSNLRMPSEQQVLKKPSLGVRIANAIIRFHQTVINPVDGPRSHFRPTSSRYMQLAMQRYGFLKGFLMGCDRLLRENDEEWVYNTVEIEGRTFKYDPAWFDKHTGLHNY
jgi:uncharacterized protein